MSRLIALTGPAGCGKSTAAAVLEAEGWVRLRFAWPLKAMLAAFYDVTGVPPEEAARRIEGDLKEKRDWHLCGETPRHAMQTLGTEWGRACMGRDFWVHAWRLAAIGALEAGDRVVVEDCRFANEAAAVRALGGRVVGLHRPGLAPHPSGHASEAGVEPDGWVVNDHRTPAPLAAAILRSARLERASA